MINLRNSPFLWLALLLLLSYAIVDLSASMGSYSDTMTLIIILLVCAVASFFKYKPGKQMISTLALSVCVLAAGSIRHLLFEKENFPTKTIDRGIKIEADVIIVKVLKVRHNMSTLRCQLINAREEKTDHNALIADKYLLVRIKGTQQGPWFPGDKITINGWLFPMQGPQNPHAFDLRQYYKTIGIRHQLTCPDSTILLHPDQGFGLMRTSAIWQAKLCDIVSQHTSVEVAQMTNALVFGERSSMDEEIRNAFANSGAMHVLSVSGMHMAIIYSMLYVILGAPGGGSISRRMVRLSLYFFSIMIYVGLTGASPAVLRAGLMIILYILGKAMGWNTQIWNLLGFAAFLMLWSNPFIWHNIGFQLSFLAMAGILLYAKPIIRYFSFRNIILHRIWEITSVSIAAQVFIIPIILHQFYQLPLTFIMSSLVAMPASYIVIFGALLNIVLSPLHLDWLWQIYDLAGQLFLSTMKWIASINPSMNFSMPLQTELSILLAALLYAIGLIYYWPNGKKLALALSIGAMFTLGWHRATQWTTNDLTVYHNYRGLVMDLIVKGRCLTIQDSAVADRNVMFSTKGNRVFRDIIHADKLHRNKSFSRANWHFSHAGFHSSALSFSFWNGKEIPVENHARSSYILINDCPDISALKKHITVNQHHVIVLPAHLDRKTKKEIAKFLDKNAIKYWDISTQGYFRLLL